MPSSRTGQSWVSLSAKFFSRQPPINILTCIFIYLKGFLRFLDVEMARGQMSWPTVDQICFCLPVTESGLCQRRRRLPYGSYLPETGIRRFYDQVCDWFPWRHAHRYSHKNNSFRFFPPIGIWWCWLSESAPAFGSCPPRRWLRGATFIAVSFGWNRNRREFMSELHHRLDFLLTISPLQTSTHY